MGEEGGFEGVGGRDVGISFGDDITTSLGMMVASAGENASEYDRVNAKNVKHEGRNGFAC